MRDELFPAVACLQFPIALGEVERNLEQVRGLLAAHSPSPGTLVLLPEIWATGFDYPHTEELGLRTPEILQTMQQLARDGEIFLAGSLTEPKSGASLPSNTLFVVGPEGPLGSIGKQHLFRFWQEDQYYQRGQQGPLITTPYGPLGGMVCYDLRFPEVAKRQAFAGSRLLIVSAQWPLSRLDHWQTLLRARAIENQAYVAACNGCGVTGTMEMAGHSMIIAPNGQVLHQADGEACLISASLDSAVVDEERRRFFPAGDRPWLQANKDKVLSLEKLLETLMPLRRHGSRVAFVSGDFPALGASEAEYLESARRRADCLVVGLTKGPTPRWQPEATPPSPSLPERARVLTALGCVDFVVLHDAAGSIPLIEARKPDVLIEGLL